MNVRELTTGRRNLSVKTVGTDTDDLTRIARSISNLGVEIGDEDLIHREYHYPYSAFGLETERSRRSITGHMGPTGEAEVLASTAVGDVPAPIGRSKPSTRPV